MDACSWRFALHPSDDDDILYAGFELDGDEEQALRERLAGAGLAFAEISPAECAQRKIGSGLWLRDPGGLRLEFVRGHALAATPFRSDLVSGFVTGDQGFGHIVLAVASLDESLDFYRMIGMELSDFITLPMGDAGELRIAFMHCNQRHHSLAIAPLPSPKRLNHIMIEVEQVDDVIQGYDRCCALGYATGKLGRHPNDRMLSFYVATPAGFDVEYGWGGVAIEGEWTVVDYDHMSLWGHERA
jgi:2,3-dihydroxybiphenyl 1,2-dioxygenase